MPSNEPSIHDYHTKRDRQRYKDKLPEALKVVKELKKLGIRNQYALDELLANPNIYYLNERKEIYLILDQHNMLSEKTIRSFNHFIFIENQEMQSYGAGKGIDTPAKLKILFSNPFYIQCRKLFPTQEKMTFFSNTFHLSEFTAQEELCSAVLRNPCIVDSMLFFLDKLFSIKPFDKEQLEKIAKIFASTHFDSVEEETNKLKKLVTKLNITTEEMASLFDELNSRLISFTVELSNTEYLVYYKTHPEKQDEIKRKVAIFNQKYFDKIEQGFKLYKENFANQIPEDEKTFELTYRSYKLPCFR